MNEIIGTAAAIVTADVAILAFVAQWMRQRMRDELAQSRVENAHLHGRVDELSKQLTSVLMRGITE